MLETPQPVSFLGNAVPWGASIIHFYYSPYEQVRSATLIADGLEEHQPAILGCTLRAYQVMAEALTELGIPPSDQRIVRVEVSANLMNSICAISEAAQRASAAGNPVRVIMDFGEIVPQESLCQAEASLSTMLRDVNAVCLTQYDGRAFAAPVTIAQFRTHALAIVGNVLYHENRQYTRPEQYLRFRTSAGGR